MSRKARGFIWLMVIAAVVAVTAYRYFGGRGREGNPGDDSREVAAERGNITVTVVTAGVVQPQNRLEIKPPIAGRIEKVLVEEGDEVRQGDILAWMSSTERAALLDAARAQGPEAAARWEDVYKPAPLVASLDGTVIVRAVEPGQTVGSQDAALVLADRLIVQAQVDETDIGRVQPGQAASITLDAYPDRDVRASVGHIAYESETVSNVTIYQVDIVPDMVPPIFRSGMSANVSITVDEKDGVLLVPVEAVRDRRGKKDVLVKQEEGEPIPSEVEVGLTDDTQVEIVSGLQEGGVVVIRRWSRDQEGLERTNPFSPFGRMRRRRR